MNLFIKEKLTSILQSSKYLKILIVYSLIISFITFLSVIKWKYWKSMFFKLRDETTTTVYPTNTPSPTTTKYPPVTCVNESSTIFTGGDTGSLFAACLEEGKYNVYHETYDGYYPMTEETGRLNMDNQIIISYEGTYARVPRRYQGSRVFIIDKSGENLAVLLDPLNIPNKEFWISGTSYYVIYVVNGDESWSLSPNKNILLLTVRSCWGCDATNYLYAYNFSNKEVKYIGSLYGDPDFYIEWIDANTLKWREGNWRPRTTDDPQGDFPAIQEDLGYHVISF